jgi:hypothetical protein
MLEAKLGMDVAVTEEFKPFAATMTSAVENTATLN